MLQEDREYNYGKNVLQEDREYNYEKNVLQEDREYNYEKNVLQEDREYNYEKNVLQEDCESTLTSPAAKSSSAAIYILFSRVDHCRLYYPAVGYVLEC